MFCNFWQDFLKPTSKSKQLIEFSQFKADSAFFFDVFPDYL